MSGEPIGELRPAEFETMTKVVGLLAGDSVAPLHTTLELSAEARKHVVVFVALLPLIAADAKQRGRTILYLTPDGRGESTARLDSKALAPLTPVQCRTWDELQPRPENGFQEERLKSFWIIGDLDWTDQPLGGDTGDRVAAAIQRVLADWSCPALLLHQQGRTQVPPSGGCFIATAACGSPFAQELQTLREFRDHVLARSVWGRSLIATYTRLSPPLARSLGRHPALRRLVRSMLLRPLADLVGSRH